MLREWRPKNQLRMTPLLIAVLMATSKLATATEMEHPNHSTRRGPATPSELMSLTMGKSEKRHYDYYVDAAQVILPSSANQYLLAHHGSGKKNELDVIVVDNENGGRRRRRRRRLKVRRRRQRPTNEDVVEQRPLRERDDKARMKEADVKNSDFIESKEKQRERHFGNNRFRPSARRSDIRKRLRETELEPSENGRPIALNYPMDMREKFPHFPSRDDTTTSHYEKELNNHVDSHVSNHHSDQHGYRDEDGRDEAGDDEELKDDVDHDQSASSIQRFSHSDRDVQHEESRVDKSNYEKKTTKNNEINMAKEQSHSTNKKYYRKKINYSTDSRQKHYNTYRSFRKSGKTYRDYREDVDYKEDLPNIKPHVVHLPFNYRDMEEKRPGKTFSYVSKMPNDNKDDTKDNYDNNKHVGEERDETGDYDSDDNDDDINNYDADDDFIPRGIKVRRRVRQQGSDVNPAFSQPLATSNAKSAKMRQETLDEGSLDEVSYDDEAFTPISSPLNVAKYPRLATNPLLPPFRQGYAAPDLYGKFVQPRRSYTRKTHEKRFGHIQQHQVRQTQQDQRPQGLRRPLRLQGGTRGESRQASLMQRRQLLQQQLLRVQAQLEQKQRGHAHPRLDRGQLRRAHRRGVTQQGHFPTFRMIHRHWAQPSTNVEHRLQLDHDQHDDPHHHADDDVHDEY